MKRTRSPFDLRAEHREPALKTARGAALIRAGVTAGRPPAAGAGVPTKASVERPSTLPPVAAFASVVPPCFQPRI